MQDEAVVFVMVHQKWKFKNFDMHGGNARKYWRHAARLTSFSITAHGKLLTHVEAVMKAEHMWSAGAALSHIFIDQCFKKNKKKTWLCTEGFYNLQPYYNFHILIQLWMDFFLKLVLKMLLEV